MGRMGRSSYIPEKMQGIGENLIIANICGMFSVSGYRQSTSHLTMNSAASYSHPLSQEVELLLLYRWGNLSKVKHFGQVGDVVQW
jgi:hypothetical protein